MRIIEKNIRVEKTFRYAKNKKSGCDNDNIVDSTDAGEQKEEKKCVKTKVNNIDNCKKCYFKEFCKKNWWVILILTVLPIVVVVGILAKFWDCMKSDKWIALCIGVLSYIGTALLGVVTVYQNHKFKKISDEKDEFLRHENEKYNAFVAEENRKENIQNLKIMANPLAHLVGVDKVSFKCADEVYCGIITSTTHNRNSLTVEPIQGKALFKEELVFTLLFDMPNGNMVDCVDINTVELKGTIGDFNDLLNSDYKIIFFSVFRKFNDEVRGVNVLYSGNNKISVPLGLLNLKAWDIPHDWKGDDDDKHAIIDKSPSFCSHIKNADIDWSLSITYSTRNNLGVSCDLESYIEFKLNESEKMEIFDIKIIKINTRLREGAYHESEVAKRKQ